MEGGRGRGRGRRRGRRRVKSNGRGRCVLCCRLRVMGRVTVRAG